MWKKKFVVIQFATNVQLKDLAHHSYLESYFINYIKKVFFLVCPH
jgi:hypothetical protein